MAPEVTGRPLSHAAPAPAKPPSILPMAILDSKEEAKPAPRPLLPRCPVLPPPPELQLVSAAEVVPPPPPLLAPSPVLLLPSRTHAGAIPAGMGRGPGSGPMSRSVKRSSARRTSSPFRRRVPFSIRTVPHATQDKFSR